MQRGTLVGLIVAIALLPLATAQDPAPAMAKIGSEAEAAAADPPGYLHDEASAGGLDEDRAWANDYGCATLREVAAKAGRSPPDLEACRVGPDLDAGPTPTPEPVAEAVPIASGPVAEAQALVGDAVGTAEAILREPPSALDHLLAFVGDAIDFAQGLADAVLDALSQALAAVCHVSISLAMGSADLLAASADITGVAFGSVADASAASHDAAIVALKTLGQASIDVSAMIMESIADATADAGRAIDQGADATINAIEASVTAVGSWFADLAGNGSGPAPEAPSGPTDALEDATGALDPVRDLVEGALA